MTRYLLFLSIIALCATNLSTAVSLSKYPNSMTPSSSFLGVHLQTDAEQQKLPPLDMNTLTPKLGEYYGQGYDIFTGNPLSPGVDKGFTAKQLFKFTYSKDRITGDGKFFYPKEVDVTSLVSCKFDSSTEEIVGMQSYHKALEARVKVEGEYDAKVSSVSFTASAGYKDESKEKKNSESINILSEIGCDLYEAVVKSKQQLSDDFKDDVAFTKQSGNWKEFINSWGTHYGFRLQLGASAVQKTTISKEDYQTLKAYNIDVGVAVSAKFATVKGGVDASLKLSNSQEEALAKTKKTQKEFYIGHLPDTKGDSREWLSSVYNAYPAPLTFSLKSIASLFHTNYFGKTYTATELQAMKSGFEAAVEEIAKTLPRVPTADTPIPPPKTLQAETKIVGGSEGEAYRDTAPKDALVKATGVSYKAGANIDGISLILGSSGETQWHGGQGGNQGTIEFKDRRVSKATVWAGKYVNGIVFSYENGADTPLIGSKEGDRFELPIYGNLAGLKGTAGGLLDSIGFISNIISLDPTNPITVPVYTMSYGGSGGGYFDSTAGKALTSNLKATSVTIRSGADVDAIRVTTNVGASPFYGGTGGGEKELNVENLSTVEIWYEDLIKGLNFIMQDGSASMHGERSGTYAKVDTPEGARLIGLYGKSGGRVDRLGFVFARSG